MIQALIIGSAGFVGSYLAKHLHNDKGWHVVATKLPNEKLELACAEIHDLDILDPVSVEELIKKVNPSFVFHLAAQSSAALSWAKPAMTVDINIKGTINVLESIKAVRQEINPRILITGSSEEYGNVKEEDCPITERHEVRPGNIYAATKICQEMIGKLYVNAFNLDVISTRSFNHIGPGQAPCFVVSDFCKQVAEIEAGLRDPIIRVGNLGAKRDFTDVRDVVQAYALLMDKGVGGEIYNVGTGKAYEIHDILGRIISMARVNIRVELDESRLRPLDIPLSVADISKLTEATGWQPMNKLNNTLEDTLNYWRNYVTVT